VCPVPPTHVAADTWTQARRADRGADLAPELFEEGRPRCSTGSSGATVIQLPQDPGQAGKAQAKNFITVLSRFTTFATPVTGDKMARALAWAGKAGAGLVLLVEGDWNDEFLTELTAFPTAAHDDQVDAASSAFDRLANNTLGIMSWYQAELVKAGKSLADIKTPYERQQEALGAATGEQQEALGAATGELPPHPVSDQHIEELAKAFGYRPPGAARGRSMPSTRCDRHRGGER
jgi:hypothetical protein